MASTALLAVSAARAQNGPILLTLNITDPNNVIVSSTGNDPSQSVNGSIGAGFDLIGLLGSSASFSQSLSSTLTTGATGTELTFNEATNDDLQGKNDVNFYNTGSDPNTFFPMTFSTSKPAFESGTSLTVDFGALTLLPVGSYGDIETGYDGSADSTTYTTPNTVIGSYEVINDETLNSTPEPASWTMALIVTAALAVLRFRVRRENGR